MWMKLMKRAILVSGMLMGVLFVVVYWAHRQSKQVPEFYERAIELPPPEQVAKSSKRMEADVQQLQDDLGHSGQWDATFEKSQINAWLVNQLPQKFPQLSKKGLQDPRIVIEDDCVKAAARFKDHRLDAVISCELRVQLTDQPNRLAISVSRLRAGALPLPISQFQEKVRKLMEKAKFELQWETRDGEPVAIIDVPREYPGRIKEDVVIESIELEDKLLRVAGRTGDLETLTFEPQGAIYEIAMAIADAASPSPSEASVETEHQPDNVRRIRSAQVTFENEDGSQASSSELVPNRKSPRSVR